MFVVSIFTSFSTMADPVAAALATISIHGLSVDDEAPNKIKIVMGVIMGVIAYLLVASGGVNSVKGIPISVLLILVVVSVFRNAAKCEAKDDNIVIEDDTE